MMSKPRATGRKFIDLKDFDNSTVHFEFVASVPDGVVVAYVGIEVV